MANTLPTELIAGFTPEEIVDLEKTIRMFRFRMGDDSPLKNILNGGSNEYSDEAIFWFLESAIEDINGGMPRCNYTIRTLKDRGVLVEGAMIAALLGSGICQARNSVNFSENGLSVNMNDKAPSYLSIVNMLLQSYAVNRMNVKNNSVLSGANSGFVGVGSMFGFTARGRGGYD